MSESNEYPEDLESNEEDIENDEQQEYEEYLQRQEEEQFQRYIESFEEEQEQEEQEEQEQEQEEQEQEQEDHDFYDRLVERLIVDLFSPHQLGLSSPSSRLQHNPIFSYEENTTTYRYPYRETEMSYTYISRNDEIAYNSDGFILNNFLQSFSDPIERVLVESLNQQPDLEKIYDKIEIESNLYSSITETNKEVEDKCCICLTEFKNDDKVSILNCKHLFHCDCITEWSTYKINCPVCRENFKE